jgi:YQGE family putative transporter
MVLIHAAYTAAQLLAATFLSIYLWRSGHDLVPIAVFNGLMAATIPVVFVLSGTVLPQAPAASTIRFGLAAIGLSYLAVLLLGASSLHWVVALGLLRGLGEGAYWVGYHVVTYDATVESDRDRYFGAMAAGNWLLTAALPPLAGAVIVTGSHWGEANLGYQLVFALSAAVLAAAMMVAGSLPAGKRSGFSLAEVLQLPHRNPAWRFVTWARLADGCTGSLIGLVLSVLTFVVLRNEQSVGNFNGLMGLLGLGVSLALAALIRPRIRYRCALIGASLLTCSTLLLPLYLSVGALVAFGFLRALGGPLHGNALAPVALSVMDRDPRARQLRFEYIVHSELCLGLGRVASIGGFLLLAAPLDQVLLARLVVVVAGAAPMVIWAALASIPRAGGNIEERALGAAA